MAEDTNNLKAQLNQMALAEFWASDPDVGQGVAGMRIARDSEYGILAVYRAADDYSFDDGTGAAALTVDVEGNVTLNNAALNLTGTGYIALGNPPPTSATTGTGIWLDDTGIYGLASNVQQTSMRASDGKIAAGAGAVALDENGISIIQSAAADSLIQWKKSNGTVIGEIGTYISVSGDNSDGSFIVDSGTNNYYGKLKLGARDRNLTDSVYLWLSALGATSTAKANLYGSNFAGIIIGGDGTDSPSSLVHLKSAAPTFRMEDTTASANSLLVKTDGNKTYLQEVGDTDGDILTLDLANARVGIGTASPGVPLDVAATISTTSGDAVHIALTDTMATDSATAFKFALNLAYTKTGAGNQTGYENGALFLASNVSGTGTQSYLFNLESRVQVTNGGATDVAHFYISPDYGGGGGTITNLMGLWILDAGRTVSGTQYGIRINDLTSGGTDYAIYTGAGLIQFGDNVNVASGKTYKVNGTQVVTARQTGWGAPTGTATRSTFATSTVTLSQLAERVKALVDDLTTHGLIGA